MFGSLGVPELLLIFAVILIVFGPRRIPEIGKTLGKAMGEFRKATDDLKSTIEREVRLEELKSIAPDIRASVNSIARLDPAPDPVPDPISKSEPSLAPLLESASNVDAAAETAPVASTANAIGEAPGAALRPEPDYLADPDKKRAGSE
ncbi:MAG: twin-arginine translocase TatA/TatE family subunit [Acidobacteriota bacterium]|nr:twin-arginine translocase TatA/TatE family subunit [Acidobacteriota bacterium]